MESLHQKIKELAHARLGKRRCLKADGVDRAPYRSFLKAVTLHLRTEHRTGHSGEPPSCMHDPS